MNKLVEIGTDATMTIKDPEYDYYITVLNDTHMKIEMVGENVVKTEIFLKSEIDILSDSIYEHFMRRERLKKLNKL